MISIRFATKNDFLEIVKLNVHEYWDEKAKWYPLDPIARYEQAMWWGDISLFKWHFTVLKSCQGGVLLAFIGNKLVGELDFALSFDNDQDKTIQRSHIIWLLVDKSYRRQGIAANLLKYLQRIVDTEIWVEAEDFRSESLYKHFGKPRKTLCTFMTTLSIHTPLHNLKHRTISYGVIEYRPTLNSLITGLKIGTYKVLIGRFYCPMFDLLQLANPDPENIIWGYMDPAPIIIYEFQNAKYIAFITQYPRLYLKGPYNTKEFSIVFQDLISKIIQLGFSPVKIQYYKDDLDNIPEEFHNNIDNYEEDTIFTIDH